MYIPPPAPAPCLTLRFLFLRSGRFYYAPNTYKELVIAERRRNGELITEDMGPKEAFTLK